MNRLPVLDRRRAGVLLHPTSLPDGTLGADARRFVDVLADTGTSVWQMLPLGPTHAEASPYHCLSVHALNPQLLPDRTAVTPDVLLLPEQAATRAAFEGFCAAAAHWLEDYALFMALRARHDTQPWWTWPVPLRDRAPDALETARNELAAELNRVRYEQFRVAMAFTELRRYAHVRGVRLFGDLPIFVAHDSADVWAQRRYFKLDADGQPRVVAGVPPDYFSATGQRWGNPLYDWNALAADGFGWWQERLATELARFDLVRIDHFRGFEACWEIPAGEPTAVNGHWQPVPGDALFTTLHARFGELPLVAEDLGIITPAVTALRQRYGLPGMLVLQFAFDGGADNPYLPHNHSPDAVVYTGTHDNDTTLAWFEALTEPARQNVLDTLKSDEPMPRALMHAALHSVATLAVIPMQDVLGLGAGHRMNIPGTTSGNWQWRFDWDQLSGEVQDWWETSLARSGRTTAMKPD
jgi:4-alpha-glucanotransferase